MNPYNFQVSWVWNLYHTEILPKKNTCHIILPLKKWGKFFTTPSFSPRAVELYRIDLEKVLPCPCLFFLDFQQIATEPLEKVKSSCLQVAGLIIAPLWFFAQWTYAAGVASTSVTASTVISTTSVVWTLLGSIVFLKEKVTATWEFIFQQAYWHTVFLIVCLFVHICFLYVGSIPPPRMQLCANEGVIFGIPHPENVMWNIILLKTSQHPRGWIQ